MQNNIEFDLELIKRYDLSGPRYTSYPTAVQFNHHFTESDYLAAMAASNQRLTALYLYIFICHFAPMFVITVPAIKLLPLIVNVLRLILAHLHQEIVYKQLMLIKAVWYSITLGRRHTNLY
jgi:hypothetical protein